MAFDKTKTPEEIRSIPQKQFMQMFFKIGILKNFVIFTGKNLCWNLY